MGSNRLQCKSCLFMHQHDSDEYEYIWTCGASDEWLGREDQAGCSYLKSKIDTEQFCSLPLEILQEIVNDFSAELLRREV